MEKERPPVFGMMQRGGQVVIHLLDNVKQKTIEPFIKDTIESGTLVYTDEYSTGVWRILYMAQIERKEISVYAMDAKPTRTAERIFPCSSSLSTIRPHSSLLSVAYTSV